MPPESLLNLWKFAPIVALLFLALWAGNKGLWYWGPGVRAHFRELERQRDEWRRLALALLKQQGIELPPDTPVEAASQKGHELR
jgi:hypothetical protein